MRLCGAIPFCASHRKNSPQSPSLRLPSNRETFFFFGLAHFTSIFYTSFYLGPIFWFASALLVGIIFGAYVIRTRRIVPCIIAHGLSNFISAFSVWTYYATSEFTTYSFINYMLEFYGVLLVAGGALALIFRKDIGQGSRVLGMLGREMRYRTIPMDFLVISVSIGFLWLLSIVFII